MISGFDDSILPLALIPALECAVPLWIARVQEMSEDERERRREVCSQIIAEHGDLLMFRSKKPGGTAEAFNALAEGLALLAFAPGGVRFCGLHWEAEPSCVATS